MANSAIMTEPLWRVIAPYERGPKGTKYNEETMAKKKVNKPWDQILQLHISLDGTSPLVWRRVLVPSVFTLEKLHSVFQFVMGWQMCHLYDFTIKGERYSEPDEYDENVKPVAANLISRVKPGEEFKYTYDFGDDWIHTVKLEEVLDREDKYNYPICIGGENACPPEDCHGPHGYAELKKTISNSKSKEYASIIQWLGGYFDPHGFDANRVNRDFLWQVAWDDEPNEQGLYLPALYKEESEEEVLRQ